MNPLARARIQNVGIGLHTSPPARIERAVLGRRAQRNPESVGLGDRAARSGQEEALRATSASTAVDPTAVT